MKGRGKFLVLGILTIVVAVGSWLWIKRDRPSYESGFAEYIWIAYPPGNMLEAEDFGGEGMDKLLRDREVGFVGGVTSKGDPPEVVEVELAVDLELLQAESLVMELKEKGLIPKESAFEAGTYPRTWPE